MTDVDSVTTYGSSSGTTSVSFAGLALVELDRLSP